MERSPPFPTEKEILTFINDQETPPSRREIARAFGLKNKDRTRLREVLKSLKDRGLLDQNKKSDTSDMSSKKKVIRGVQSYQPFRVPDVLPIRIESVTDEGDLVARPTDENYQAITVMVDGKRAARRKPPPGVGDRLLVRLTPSSDKLMFWGDIIRTLGRQSETFYGFVRKASRGFSFLPVDRSFKRLLNLQVPRSLKLKPGDFISGKLHRHRGQFTVTPEQILGHESDKHIISAIAIHTKGLREHFPIEAIKLAEKAELPSVENREDLRELPLVTIDGEDARDFDDAVFAEKEREGWHIVVAIADVAYYVRQGDALDQEALLRGNSTYFPDRVLPMLPEALSNGLCSLKPGEDRACLAVHMWINKQGLLKKHQFVRGIMRSHARLTYSEAQKALDGKISGLEKGFISTEVKSLYGAYLCLQNARDERGSLDFDKDEPKVLIDKQGNPSGVEFNERLESHRLIEEFMITANVAAAKTLEEKGFPCLYRVHEPPNPEKVDDLRESLKGLGLKMAKAQSLQPKVFKHILQHVKGSPIEHLVNQLVLRTQARASYSPKNGGHFGLNLPRYAHFTSPIRRYADLVVHRALISCCKLGEGGLPKDFKPTTLEEVASHISETERTSDKAAWDTVERFTALLLMPQVNKVFSGRIDGVARAGLFIELEGTAATGFLPRRMLSDNPYEFAFDPVHHQLKSRRKTYTLGDTLDVYLAEANPLTGNILLGLG